MTDDDPSWAAASERPYDWARDEPSYLLTLWWAFLEGAQNALRLVTLVVGFVSTLFVSGALLILAAHLLR